MLDRESEVVLLMNRTSTLQAMIAVIWITPNEDYNKESRNVDGNDNGSSEDVDILTLHWSVLTEDLKLPNILATNGPEYNLPPGSGK